MSQINNSTFTNQMFDKAEKGLKETASKIETALNSTEPLGEIEMMKLNMDVSRHTTLTSLMSGIVKNLTDTEKQVANKM